MSTANSNSMHRSWYRWLILVPFLIGASFAFLNYAGWAGIYSAYYDRPAEAWRLKEAGPKADVYWWSFLGLSGIAAIIATLLIPSLKSETIPAGLKTVIRLSLAIGLVAASIYVGVFGLSAVGRFLK
jgi:hypothetical protein